MRRQAHSGSVDIVLDDVGTIEPALVLIHPAASDRRHYREVISHLGDRRVIVLDLPGHGESGRPDAGVGIDSLAADVVAVCREAHVERAVYCGHSMGAAVALKAAAMDPSMTAGIAMLDGTVLLPEPIRRQALETLVPALRGPHWLEALRAYFGERMFGLFDPPDLKAKVLDELADADPQIVAAVFHDIFSTDFAADLRDAPCPLLYVHARFPADLGRLRELRPDAQVASVVGSGHFIALVVPEQVAAMLERFVTILPLVPSRP